MQEKISKFVKVNTIPNILSLLLVEIDSDKSTIASIAKIISKDISLMARLLRMANSPFYRRSKEISTIDNAITVLGIKAVKALSLSVSMLDIAGGISKSGLIDFKEFWLHNLEVAVISRQLAGKIKGCQPEEAFTCGLMHDLGILFFVQEFPEKYVKVLQATTPDKPLEENESEIFGMNHAEVGGRIAEAWKLPKVISQSISNHHNDNLSEIENGQVDVWQIVNLGHRFCRQGVDIGNDLSNERVEQRHQLSRAMGIDTESACKILAEVPNQVLDAAAFLDVEIGDLMHLLKKANAQLGNLYEEYEISIIENQKLQNKIIEQEKHRVALEALRTTLATFSHYVNNATAAIIGRAQILDLYLAQGKLDDPEGRISHSVKIISESVDTICAVLDELKEFPVFKTTTYHGASKILDIDNEIKERLGRLT
ncbi:MAG: HDOD domain-containing protein [candidate division Zixibacteria bacterium]|nr:HDOD domain-containing protein [candidate division Zixibacteria bacterium]